MRVVLRVGAHHFDVREGGLGASVGEFGDQALLVLVGGLVGEALARARGAVQLEFHVGGGLVGLERWLLDHIPQRQVCGVPQLRGAEEVGAHLRVEGELAAPVAPDARVRGRHLVVDDGGAPVGEPEQHVHLARDGPPARALARDRVRERRDERGLDADHLDARSPPAPPGVVGDHQRLGQRRRVGVVLAAIVAPILVTPHRVQGGIQRAVPARVALPRLPPRFQRRVHGGPKGGRGGLGCAGGARELVAVVVLAGAGAPALEA